MIQTETFRVSGIRCEHCVVKLRVALRDQEGLEAARANLMGEVTLSWNDEVVDRQSLVDTLAGAGFKEVQTL